MISKQSVNSASQSTESTTEQDSYFLAMRQEKVQCGKFLNSPCWDWFLLFEWVWVHHEALESSKTGFGSKLRHKLCGFHTSCVASKVWLYLSEPKFPCLGKKSTLRGLKTNVAIYVKEYRIMRGKKRHSTSVQLHFPFSYLEASFIRSLFKCPFLHDPPYP